MISGGPGDDGVFGGSGEDFIDGRNGNDHVKGYAGDDLLFGDRGNDYMEGHDGNDILDGGNGIDTLLGGAGEDILITGDGRIDVLDGGAGNDRLTGDEGEDRFSFSKEGGYVTRSTGDDNFPTGNIASPSMGHDIITDFEPGVDKINLSSFVYYQSLENGRYSNDAEQIQSVDDLQIQDDENGNAVISLPGDTYRRIESDSTTGTSSTVNVAIEEGSITVIGVSADLLRSNPDNFILPDAQSTGSANDIPDTPSGGTSNNGSAVFDDIIIRSTQ